MMQATLITTQNRFNAVTIWPILAAIVLLALPGFAHGAAGKAIFVLGKVSVLAENGNGRILHKGGEVNAGEIVITDDRAHAQIRMEDGGLIAVRPNSRFRFDEFVYNGDKESDKSTFSLIKGGFRSVTGAIGHVNKKAYSVKTPVATIGIRGTDYTARLCNMDCGDIVTNDGLYVGVLSGGVVLTNDQGSVDLDPNQHGFVGDSFTSPTQLMEAPSNLLFVQANPTTDTATASSNLLQTADSNTQGDVSWGRWSGSSVSTVNVVGADLSSESLHMIAALDTTSIALPSSGTANYTVVGGTAPTDGVTDGVLTAASLNVDFAAHTVDVGLELDHGGDQWSAQSTGAQLNADGTFASAFDYVAVTSSGTYSNPRGLFDGALGVSTTGGTPGDATLTYQVSGDTKNVFGNDVVKTITGVATLGLTP